MENEIIETGLNEYYNLEYVNQSLKNNPKYEKLERINDT